MKKKTIYIGSNYRTAEYLLHSSNFELSGIICESIHMTDEMLTLSLVRNVEVSVISNKAELLETLQSFGSDYIYIMHIFGMRIPMDKLDGFNIYNIHPSTLPRYKGPHPTYWQTVNNELKIGISLHEITNALDEGLLIGQYDIDYYLWNNEKDLSEQLEQLIPKLLDDLYRYIESGKKSAVSIPAGDYYPKVSRKDVFINLDSDDPMTIYNKVRAEAAYGGAKIILGNNIYCLYHIVFSKRILHEAYIEDAKQLSIKYNESLAIVSNHYKQFEGEFKFNYEK